MSTPEGCVGGRLKSSKKMKIRRKGKKGTAFKRRSVSSSRMLSDDNSEGPASAPPPLHRTSFTNPTFQGPSSSSMPKISLLFDISLSPSLSPY